MSDHTRLIDRLINLRDEELIYVLQNVFAHKTPNAEEAEFNRNKYFLGTASSIMEDEQDDPAMPKWGPWQIEAVGYIDRDQYPGDDLGPDYGFCQFGTCSNCRTHVRSNVKHAICPICDNKVYLT